ARGGAELQGKARGCRFRPGATGEGKAGRANTSEPLMMSCYSSSPGRVARPGGQGLAAGKRQAATVDTGTGAGKPPPPAHRGRPPEPGLTRAEHGSPVRVRAAGLAR